MKLLFKLSTHLILFTFKNHHYINRLNSNSKGDPWPSISRGFSIQSFLSPMDQLKILPVEFTIPTIQLKIRNKKRKWRVSIWSRPMVIWISLPWSDNRIVVLQSQYIDLNRDRGSSNAILYFLLYKLCDVRRCAR